MQFELRFSSDLRPLLVRWRHALGATREERQHWYALLTRVMRERLQAHEGRPPEAVEMDSREPSVYWWWFGDLLFVKYKVEDEPPRPRRWWHVARFIRRLFKNHRSVTVTVLDLNLPPGRTAS